MLLERANQTLAIGESLLLSLMGILVVFLELILLAGMILLISRVIGRLAANKPAQQPQAATPEPAPQPRPQVELVGVDEATAAVLMALVAHQSGIPLERLVFRSIRALD